MRSNLEVNPQALRYENRTAAADVVTAALGSAEPSVASAEPGEASPIYVPLSAREWEVVRLVARGLKNREIAEHLVLAERIVSSHLERIFAKLHMTSRAARFE